MKSRYLQNGHTKDINETVILFLFKLASAYIKYRIEIGSYT